MPLPKPVIVPGARSWATDLIRLAGGWCGVPFANYRPQVVQRRNGWQDTPALLLFWRGYGHKQKYLI
jgi:hypothetical protein